MAKHSPHPCILCGEVTTNRTYCDLHHKMLTRPPSFGRDRKIITADVASYSRRKKDINTLFGGD